MVPVRGSLSGYVQFYDPESIGNTQKSRNHGNTAGFRFVANRDEDRITGLLEVGVEDIIWTPDGLDYDQPRPEPESHCSITLEG